MTVRIAHATDIHWTLVPPVRRLWGKRLLGAANQIVGGRGHRYPQAVQRTLVEHLALLRPDAVLISGDLTQTSLQGEFELARDALRPVLDALPTLVLPGNHDVYTTGARRDGRFARYFGPWSGLASESAPLARLDVGPVTLIGLDPCRPGLLSSGRVPEEQLEALGRFLASDLGDRHVILALHYPLLDRKGRVYDGVEHGLRNAGDLIAVLREAPRKPILIVHGHEHRGFRVDLPLGDAVVPICNPGTGGHAFMPRLKRHASMNVYVVHADGTFEVERHVHDGAAFVPEPGGAYATA